MNLKKFLVGVVALATVASLTACSSADLTWSAKSGELEFSPGTYLYYAVDGYNDAIYNKIDAEERDNAFSITVEDVSLKEYMETYAQDKIKEAVIIENEFKEKGLTFTENDQKTTEANSEEYWKWLSEKFQDAGVSKDSFIYCMKIVSMREKLFNKYDEEKVLTDEEISAYETEILKENVFGNVFTVFTLDDEGNKFDDEKKAETKKIAEGYLQRIKDGEDFGDIYDEYALSNDPTYVTPEEEVGNKSRMMDVIGRDSKYFEQEATDYLIDDMEIGAIEIVEDENGFIIMEKLDLSLETTRLADLVDFEASKDNIEDFEADMEAKIDTAEVEFNQHFIDKYDMKAVAKSFDK